MKTTTEELLKGMKMYHFTLSFNKGKWNSIKASYWIISSSKKNIINHYKVYAPAIAKVFYGKKLKNSDISVCTEIPVSEFDEFPVIFYNVLLGKLDILYWKELKKLNNDEMRSLLYKKQK